MTRQGIEHRRRTIARLYELGYSCKQIGDEIGLHKQSVKENLQSQGLYEGFRDVCVSKGGVKHSVRYWAELYGIPVGSCWQAFKKHDIGRISKGGLGNIRELTEREFVAGAIYTHKGREVISKMFLNGLLLTKKEIKANLRP